MVEPKMGYDEGSFPEHPMMSSTFEDRCVTSQEFKEKTNADLDIERDLRQRIRDGVDLTLNVEAYLRNELWDLRRKLRVAVIGGTVVSVSLSTGILAIYDLMGN